MSKKKASVVKKLYPLVPIIPFSSRICTHLPSPVLYVFGGNWAKGRQPELGLVLDIVQGPPWDMYSKIRGSGLYVALFGKDDKVETERLKIRLVGGFYTLYHLLTLYLSFNNKEMQKGKLIKMFLSASDLDNNKVIRVSKNVVRINLGKAEIIVGELLDMLRYSSVTKNYLLTIPPSAKENIYIRKILKKAGGT